MSGLLPSPHPPPPPQSIRALYSLPRKVASARLAFNTSYHQIHFAKVGQFHFVSPENKSLFQSFIAFHPSRVTLNTCSLGFHRSIKFFLIDSFYFISMFPAVFLDISFFSSFPICQNLYLLEERTIQWKEHAWDLEVWGSSFT